eukprot:7380512-Prymnesium_polylepis.1
MKIVWITHSGLSVRRRMEDNSMFVPLDAKESKALQNLALEQVFPQFDASLQAALKAGTANVVPNMGTRVKSRSLSKRRLQSLQWTDSSGRLWEKDDDNLIPDDNSFFLCSTDFVDSD